MPWCQVPQLTLACSSVPKQQCTNVCSNVFWCKVRENLVKDSIEVP